ncbi:MAG: tRNA (adenosine(37)-N6)-threonylcarbamoyltransferase complex dimerization subunit type 1 TsaB [Rhodoblastus sp.]|nr:MAG: tRNA (adenosine(37)-N6)-threonylcarbamoyltransferase complex dimerization subunit type 1 TsaB [Rhodoblastus sp.]
MKLLAIDTALGATSACVLAAGESEPESLETIVMERGHAEALLPLIERVVDAVEGGMDAISRIAVTVGPGSFTGIRIGIAAARAIGLAREAPVVGVSTLAALAAPVIAARVAGLVVAAVDARHGSIFAQAYASGGKTLLSPRLTTPREAVRALGRGPFRIVGSGAQALAAEAAAMGIPSEIVTQEPYADIAFVARLGYLADPGTAPPKPLYLKAPDAKAQTNGRIPRAAGSGA